ncbi:hypothetical protein OG871_33785 [Kitasatospora sp. NBC_00374]|uniref:hypothetical protein n=1 Tax=Kitasatospora sp. NBC_00374 TaxID=2975964 RepID=UPI0030E1E1EC
MFASPRSTFRWAAVVAGATGALVLALGASGPSPQPGHSGHSGTAGMAGMDHGATAMPSMPAMSGMAAGEGLLPELDGYRMDSPATALPAGRATGYPFTITGPDGRPITDFAVAQTRKLHFYAIRSDLTGYQHLHPTMAADGTWTADLAALEPGDWRLYASFTPNTGPHRGTELVFSRVVTVPGEAAAVPLPAAAGSTTVDGYTVALQEGPTAGMTHRLTVTVSKDGRPVTDLQPYLDSYAHLSAFHAGDQALAHLHPGNALDGDHGGPTLTFDAMIGEPGDWRVFLQFQTAGQVHTAVLTWRVA